MAARWAVTRAAPAALDRTATPAVPPSSWKVLTSADRGRPSAAAASVSEAVKAVTNVAPIPSAAMLSPATIAAGWAQRAAMAYPAAARRRPVTATIRAWRRAQQRRLPACAPATRRDGDRQERQAHVQGAVAVRVLQREGAQEESADQQPGGGQHQEAASQHRSAAEQADGEQRDGRTRRSSSAKAVHIAAASTSGSTVDAADQPWLPTLISP